MQEEFPLDPFGIAAAERQCWRDFKESGCWDFISARVSDIPGRSERELEILTHRLAGTEIPDGPKSLFQIETLQHAAELAKAAGVDVNSVFASLQNWNRLVRPVLGFMTGRCHELAIAGHKLTGWPMVAFRSPNPFTPDGAPECTAHIALLHPSGDVVDILGRHSQSEVAWSYGMRPCEMTVVSQSDIEAFSDLSPIKDTEEAYHMFLTLIGKRPATAPIDELDGIWINPPNW
jgi:hypothetical protein